MQQDEPEAPRGPKHLTDPFAKLHFEREIIESDAHALRRRIRHLRGSIPAASRRDRPRIAEEIEKLTAERSDLLARAEVLTARLEQLLRPA